ncbi:MAG: nitrite reductase small subunit NirD [Pseudomonadota bacterium]
MAAAEKQAWETVCQQSDLVPGSGVAALLGHEQIALFYLPNERQQIFAVSNRDPIGCANVLSRGIVGDLGGELVVASPLYKQHFSLTSGVCLEDLEVKIEVYDARLEGGEVLIARR